MGNLRQFAFGLMKEVKNIGDARIVEVMKFLKLKKKKFYEKRDCSQPIG
jgi:hypothetical protein